MAREECGGCRSDHGGLGALGGNGAWNRRRAGLGGGDDLGVPGAVCRPQRPGQGGEAVGDEVGGSFGAAHLCEGEDVGHAGADAGIQGPPEIDLPVGAQECEADPGL